MMTVTNMFFGLNEVVPTREPEGKPEMTLIRPLSPRESQIVELLGRGRTPKEVAFELGIAAATVRVLISRAAKKGGRVRFR